MARIEGDVTDDISFGIFLGKITRAATSCRSATNSRRVSGCRRIRNTISTGENSSRRSPFIRKTFASKYRRVGSPADAIPLVKAELEKLGPGRCRKEDRSELNEASRVIAPKQRSRDRPSCRAIPAFARKFGMGDKVSRGEKILSACMTGSGSERHPCGHCGVRNFILHRAAVPNGGCHAPMPRGSPRRGRRECVRWLRFSGEGIDVIGQELLRQGDVDLSFVLFEQLRPALVAGSR